MANVKISELPAATSVAGADYFVIVQGGTTKQISDTNLAKANTSFNNIPTTTQLNLGVQTWVNAVFPNLVTFSMVNGTSNVGNQGIIGVSRTSDSTNTGGQSCIGAGGLVNNDNATQVQSVYGGYFEARRQAGAGVTQATESNVLNFGSVVSVDPYQMGTTGLTAAYWASSGRPDFPSGATDSSVAYAAINNGSKFYRGVVFGQDALDTTFNEMLTGSLAHNVAWYSAAGTRLASINGVASNYNAQSNTAPYTINLIRARASNANANAGDTLYKIDGYQTQSATPYQQTSIRSTVVTAAANGRCSVGLYSKNDLVTEIGVELNAVNNSFTPTVDNAIGLGSASFRWSQLYAGTATINTSDRNQKQDIADISQAVIDVFWKVAPKQFRWKDAVAEKGDAARYHFGYIAQDWIEAFEEAGLDPFSFGLVCADPLTESVEIEVEEDQPVFETIETEGYDETVIDGRIVQKPVTHRREQAVYDTLLVFDEAGNPVMDEAHNRQITRDVPRTEKVLVTRIENRPALNADGSPKMLYGLRQSTIEAIATAAFRQRLENRA
jgi:hypothetical protein